MVIVKISTYEPGSLQSFKVLREGRKQQYRFDERGIALVANIPYREDEMRRGLEIIGGSFKGDNSRIVSSVNDMMGLGWSSGSDYKDSYGNVVRYHALEIQRGSAKIGSGFEFEDVNWVVRNYELGAWASGVKKMHRSKAKSEVNWDQASPIPVLKLREHVNELIGIPGIHNEGLILTRIGSHEVFGEISRNKNNERFKIPVRGTWKGDVLTLVETKRFGRSSQRMIYEGSFRWKRAHGYEFLKFVATESTVGEAAMKRVDRLLRRGTLSSNAKEVCAVFSMWDMWDKSSRWKVRSWAQKLLKEALVDRSAKHCATKAVLTALTAGANQGANVMGEIPAFEHMGLKFSARQKMKFARKAFDENPTCRNAYSMERLINMGERRKKVPPLYERCLRQDKDKLGYQRAAEFFMNTGNYNRALAIVRGGLREDNKWSSFHKLMGKIYLLQNKKAEAIAALRLAATHNKGYGGVEALGDACSTIKDYECALKSYSSSPRKSGPQKSWNLGKVYYLKGDLESARTHMKSAVAGYVAGAESDPNSVRALSSAAWKLATVPFAELRDGVRALQLATRAVEITKGNDPNTLSQLAAALAELGRWSEATKKAKKALALCKKQYYDCSGFSRVYQSIRSRNPIRDPRKD